jgi:hypothetical protein
MPPPLSWKERAKFATAFVFNLGLRLGVMVMLRTIVLILKYRRPFAVLTVVLRVAAYFAFQSQVAATLDRNAAAVSGLCVAPTPAGHIATVGEAAVIGGDAVIKNPNQRSADPPVRHHELWVPVRFVRHVSTQLAFGVVASTWSLVASVATRPWALLMPWEWVPHVTGAAWSTVAGTVTVSRDLALASFRADPAAMRDALGLLGRRRRRGAEGERGEGEGEEGDAAGPCVPLESDTGNTMLAVPLMAASDAHLLLQRPRFNRKLHLALQVAPAVAGWIAAAAGSARASLWRESLRVVALHAILVVRFDNALPRAAAPMAAEKCDAAGPMDQENCDTPPPPPGGGGGGGGGLGGDDEGPSFLRRAAISAAALAIAMVSLAVRVTISTLIKARPRTGASGAADGADGGGGNAVGGESGFEAASSRITADLMGDAQRAISLAQSVFRPRAAAGGAGAGAGARGGQQPPMSAAQTRALNAAQMRGLLSEMSVLSSNLEAVLDESGSATVAAGVGDNGGGLGDNNRRHRDGPGGGDSRNAELGAEQLYGAAADNHGRRADADASDGASAVSGAAFAVSGTAAAAAAAAPHARCIVCLDEDAVIEFHPCGHRAACAECYQAMFFPHVLRDAYSEQPQPEQRDVGPPREPMAAVCPVCRIPFLDGRLRPVRGAARGQAGKDTAGGVTHSQAELARLAQAYLGPEGAAHLARLSDPGRAAVLRFLEFCKTA